jgi:flavin reductase (DIM6/NTAB) family NADH-FMN oxidoreductase RutF
LRDRQLLDERRHLVHHVVQPRVLYFGTPVVLISTLNPDGTPNLAPMSSAWWLGRAAVLGLADSSHTAANLRRTRECVLNLAAPEQVAAVDRLALLTGSVEIPPGKLAKGYRHEADKFGASGLTPVPADLVGPPRVHECGISLEARVESVTALGAAGAGCSAIEVAVIRCHVAKHLLVPGRESYIDPTAWDPLIMKFTEYFGGGRNVHPSSLAAGWGMQHESCRDLADPDRPHPTQLVIRPS